VDPEPGEEVFFHGHPSWRSLALFYAKGLLASLVIGIVAGIASAIADGTVQAGWVIAVVLVVFVILIFAGQIKRVQTTYSITNQRLTIETGLLTRELHETRLERVQNVNSHQTLSQRMLRVGSVDFDTAGAPSSISPSTASATRARSCAQSTGRCAPCGPTRTPRPTRASSLSQAPPSRPGRVNFGDLVPPLDPKRQRSLPGPGGVGTLAFWFHPLDPKRQSSPGASAERPSLTNVGVWRPTDGRQSLKVRNRALDASRC